MEIWHFHILLCRGKVPYFLWCWLVSLCHHSKKKNPLNVLGYNFLVRMMQILKTICFQQTKCVTQPCKWFLQNWLAQYFFVPALCLRVCFLGNEFAVLILPDICMVICSGWVSMGTFETMRKKSMVGGIWSIQKHCITVEFIKCIFR